MNRTAIVIVVLAALAAPSAAAPPAPAAKPGACYPCGCGPKQLPGCYCRRDTAGTETCFPNEQQCNPKGTQRPVAQPKKAAAPAGACAQSTCFGGTRACYCLPNPGGKTCFPTPEECDNFAAGKK